MTDATGSGRISLRSEGEFIAELNQQLLAPVPEGSCSAVLRIRLDGYVPPVAIGGNVEAMGVVRASLDRLWECFQPHDLVANPRPDIILALLRNLRCEEDLKLICDRIVKMGERPFRLLGMQYQNGFRVGAAIVGRLQGDAASVIQQATSAMHRTYGQGWNDFELLTSDFAERHSEIESYARYALRNKTLGLSFQPQYTRDDEFVGVGVLAQMQIPRAEWLAGEDFLPWVEDSELILQISNQTLRSVCLQASNWRRRHIPVSSLSVTIPTAHFLQADFLETVFALLKEGGVPGGALEFCLAESTLMANVEATTMILGALSSTGLRFCICGSGLAPVSIAHLRSLPIQTLQVSCSETMLPPMYSVHVLRAVISHGKRLGLKTRISDVRSEEQLVSLKEEGCDAYQGRPLSRPLSLREVERARHVRPVGPRKDSLTEGSIRLEEAV